MSVTYPRARRLPRGPCPSLASMVRNAAAVLIIVTLVLGLLASRWGSSSTPAGTVEELARLRYANTLLQTKVQQYEARVEAADAGAPHQSPMHPGPDCASGVLPPSTPAFGYAQGRTASAQPTFE